MRKKIFLIFLFFFFFPAGILHAGTKIIGIVPLNSGYSYLGLAAGGEIFSALAKSQIYTAVILLGLTVSIFKSMQAKSLNYFLVYLITVSFISILFFGRQSSVGTPKSYAETRGDVAYKASDVVKKRGYSMNATTSHGFLWINSMEDSLVRLVVNGVDKVTAEKGEGFFDGQTLSFIWTKEFVDNMKIGDKGLAGRLTAFAEGSWYNALGKFDAAAEDGTLSIPPSSRGGYEYPTWPGDPALVGEAGYGKGFYTPGEKAEWFKLRDDLYEYAISLMPQESADKTRNVARMKKYLRLFGSEGRYKSDVAKTLYNNSKEDLNPAAMAVQKINRAAGGKESSVVTKGFIGAFMRLSRTFLIGALKAFPVVQSYFLFLAFALFPLVLLICLLPFPGQQVRILFMYFMSLFWLKSWTITTAFAANFSQIGWHTGDYISHQAISYITPLLILLGPIFLWPLIMSGSIAGASAMNSSIAGAASGGASMAEGAAKTAL